jgi:hypothetical protein
MLGVEGADGWLAQLGREQGVAGAQQQGAITGLAALRVGRVAPRRA